MNNKTIIIEFGFVSYHMKNYGDLGGCLIRLSLRPRRITPSSISIILHKILMQPHSLIVNYFKKTNLVNLMATRIKRGRSSMSLLLINPAGQSGKELSLNGDISIT